MVKAATGQIQKLLEELYQQDACRKSNNTAVLPLFFFNVIVAIVILQATNYTKYIALTIYASLLVNGSATATTAHRLEKTECFMTETFFIMRKKTCII